MSDRLTTHQTRVPDGRTALQAYSDTMADALDALSEGYPSEAARLTDEAQGYLALCKRKEA